jgi:hypothetical protein
LKVGHNAAMDQALVRAERSPTRCPFCRDELAATKDEVSACAGCGALHHAACHRTHGRCAACGGTDVLVSPQRPRRRDQPPKGSKIHVSNGAETTAFIYDVGNGTDWVLVVLLAVLVLSLPLAVWIVLLRRRHKQQQVRLGDGWLEFPVAKGLGVLTLRVPRADLGAVRVTSNQQLSLLTIDVGIKRHTVWTGPLHPALSPPEMEWLAEQINAWRDQA